MSKKAACRCKAAECEECPEWIFTFADLVMLMMGFFVILWVLKPNPNKTPPGAAGAAAAAAAQASDLVKAEASIREAFGYTPNPGSTDPIDQVIIQHLQTLKMTGPGQKGKTELERKGAMGVEEEVTAIRTAKQVTTGGKLLFDPADSELSPEMMTSLDQVADLVRGHRNLVLVKGHSGLDDLPEGATPQQKMDLSLKRAQHVADYLVSKGVAAEILRVEGCSTFEPVAQRAYTPEGRAANRRVEVEATATLIDALQDQPTTYPTMIDPGADSPAPPTINGKQD